MIAELEVLVKALDAVIEARSGAEATRVQEIYESRLGDVLSRHPVFRDTGLPFWWTSPIDAGYGLRRNPLPFLQRHEVG